MKCFIFLLALLCLYAFFLSRTSGQFCNGPKRGYINDTAGTPTENNDFLTVGFLFPFHGPGQDGTACSSDIPAPETMQFLEMARYTLWFEGIPGVRIALEAFDSCYSDQVAIEQAVRYINDRLSVTGGSQSCPEDSFKPGIIFHGAGNVGPSVGAFLTDAQVPAVSYAATQSQLTNDDEFLYFSRTIPSDRDEAMAISDTLLRLDWTYVSVIHSEAPDDASAMESFKTAATRSNICISKTTSFSADASDVDIGNIILDLLVNNVDGPSVVVIFASAEQASLVLSWADNNQLNTRAGQIQWIFGQHAMSDTSFIDALPVTATRGIIGVIPNDLVKTPTHSFADFFKMQRPSTVSSVENPWFNEFWQEAYQCNLPGSTKYPVPCGATHETLHQNTELNPHTQLISNALRNFLTGLNNAQQAKCGSGSTGLCTAFRNMPPNELLEYIKGAGYKLNGDPATVKFAIQNYKTGSNNYFSMTTVGSWEEGPAGLTLDPADLELWSDHGMEPTISKCGKDCFDESCVLAANVTTVYRPGDIILGGMFAVHHPNEDQCGDINELGIQRLEAMLFALDKLNQDSAILPGITVGVDGFDTCGVPDIAGHLALQLSASADFGKSGSGERRGPSGLPEHIYAVIGPDTDDECELVSQITNVYELPIMGYAADSGVLSNLYSYPNFARVIPPSQAQASAMVELIYRQGWQYMNVLYSDNTFGLYGSNTIQSVGMSRDVCTTNKLKVPADNSATEWDKIFNNLDRRADARVLVLFLEASDIRNLFSQLTMRNKVGQYFIVASDRWPFLQQDLITDFPDLVRGITVVTTPLREFTEFKNYFTNLRPDSNVRNPWFAEYWENKFQCSLDGDGTPCSGTSAVNPNDLTDKYVAEVIDSVYAVGRALDALQKTLCPGQTRICIEMTRAPGMDLWRLIVQQRFTSINQDQNIISFNTLGDGAPVYHIYNYQSAVNGGSFDFVKIGHYEYYAYTGGIDNNRLKVYDEQGYEITSPQSVCSGQCHDCQRADEGTTAEIKDGDVWLGGFFRLHNIGPDKLTCTDEVVLYNMPLLEAFLFAIDSINEDPNVLPNIKLGAIGFDTCGSPSRAKREAANFITAAVEYRGGYFTNRLTVSGIIGEETSDTTLALAETVTPLKVSQISYAATTTKLDDREKYPYFMRTVASDRLQATAMLDVLVKFNWKYVSVVYSDDEFGNDMYNNIKNQTEEKDICIALTLKVLDSFVDSDFNTIVKELQFNTQAKVVLLLMSELHTKSLLREAEQLGIVDLQWVGADTWGMRDAIIENSRKTALGSVVLQFRSDPVPGFQEYFTSRPTYTNLRNPWWKQYISDLFQCNLPAVDVPAKYDTQCPYVLNFDPVYQEPPEVQHIVRAVNIFAVGLQFALSDLCPNVTSYVCQQVLENPEALNENIRKAGFQHTDGSTFQFDDLGNGPGNYDILNVQPMQNTVAYTKVGSWNSGTLDLNTRNVQLYNGQNPIGLFETQCQGRCNECRKESTKNPEFIPVSGQIQIPGLFDVHEQGDHRVECREVRESGVLNVEAFLFAINRINDDGRLLPNVKVGTTAFDTCMTGSRGVRELSGLLSGMETYSDDQKLPGFSTIVGVVGAESDAVTKDTAALTSQYKYAQVSYGPGSEGVSSDPYLLQAGPSYTTQAKAVLALIKTYKWQYISVVQGADRAFSQGASEFLKLANADNICAATNQVLESPANVSTIVSDLTRFADIGARVVVVFSNSSDIRALLSEVSRRSSGSSASRLTWILAFPDSIAPSDLITGFAVNEILRGALAITPKEALPSDFEQYIQRLTPEQNTVNPWLEEIGSFSEATVTEYGQKAAYVIDATYAIAHGIHNLLTRLCPNGIMCSDFLAASPDDFYNEIAGISFAGINSNPIAFSGGSLVQCYEVSNFQRTGGSYTMVKVGTWKSGDDSPILSNSVRLFDGISDVDNIDSSCSSSLACATCVAPPSDPPPTRPRPTPMRTEAPPSKKPPGTDNTVGKLKGTPSSDIGSLWFIILVILCVIGIIVTIVVISLLVWRWDEPITRTISPFLCLVILIGIILLYVVTPIYAVPVSKAICALQRVFPGLAWAVCLSGVFLQVMRHWRIGRRERRISGAKVSFVNNSSQVVLFLFLFAFQVILAVEWLIIEPPSLRVSDIQRSPASPSPDGSSMATPTAEAILECAYTKQSMVTYCIFIYALLLLSLFVSIVARRYGHVISVMELNTLLICNFVNVVIVAIWVVIELIIKGDYHRPATSAATALTATTTLIILFAYRVKVLFRNHDPFVDTASVASGQYFSGTLNRVPSVLRNSNAEHVYDSPPTDTNGVGLNMNFATSNGSTSSLEKPKMGSDTTGF